MSDEAVAVEETERRPAEVLEVLGDECSRHILASTSEEHKTAKDLTEDCPVSATTVYRRINSLVDCGLLHEESTFPTNGTGTKRYGAAVDTVEVSVDRDGFDVRTHDEYGHVERLSRLLSAMPFENVEAEVADGELRLSVPLTDEFFEEVAAVWGERALGGRDAG